jgi:hypothetical protein
VTAVIVLQTAVLILIELNSGTNLTDGKKEDIL